MSILENIILIACVSIISFVIGNIFNSSVEKRFYQTQREILHESERVMRRQYKEMENALEYVQELLDQLDEPETLSQEWIDENKVERISDLRKMTTSDVVPVEKLENLLIPKKDKPVEELEK